MSKTKIAQRSFTFLTWNLCLLENSNQAPSSWRIDQAEAKVRELVLELDPDFVFFQELPGLVPYVETHDLVPANTTSHSGNIATIARKELMDELDSKSIGGFAVMTSVLSAGITFANVHLEPGRNGDDQRLESISRIIDDCRTPGLAIIGDTNTRTSEEDSLGAIGLSGALPPAATWNSRINLFRERGRKYTAYYTRYFHNQFIQVNCVEVRNRPIEEHGKRFHLSDHFPMSGKVSALPTPPEKDKQS